MTNRPDLRNVPLDSQLTAIFGEPISIYTRDQAVEDGALVDVTSWAGSGPDGMLDGFAVPVTFTQALWAVVDVDAERQDEGAAWRAQVRHLGESTRGRAHDVLWMAGLAARRNADTDRIRFATLITHETSGGRVRRQRVLLEGRLDADGIVIGLPEDF